MLPVLRLTAYNFCMFAHEKRISEANRQAYYASAAKRFALDAKIMRCRATVHVEDKDDIVFWYSLLKHFRPQDRFHFIAGSRNEFGNETKGVTQCLKYLHHLSPSFFICIDSDYRYLLREKGMDIRHHVFQTYTYSFENHHCFAEGLDDVCARVTHLENRIFDFRRFLSEFSTIIYELFMWHLYFQNADPERFSKYEFNTYINLIPCRPTPLISHNAARALEELKMRVDRKTGFLGRHYPNADLETIRERYRKLGLLPETAYLFVRGHNMYDMISLVCKEVCKTLLRLAKGNRKITQEMIRELYKNRNSVDEQLRQNIKYGAYPPIRQIEKDMLFYFGKN